MRRLAVFGSSPAHRALATAGGRGIAYVDAKQAQGRLHGALVELGPRAAAQLKAARALVKDAPVGALAMKPSAGSRARAAIPGLRLLRGRPRQGRSHRLPRAERARRAPAATVDRPRSRGRAQEDGPSAGHPHGHREDRQLDPGAAQGHRAHHGARSRSSSPPRPGRCSWWTRRSRS